MGIAVPAPCLPLQRVLAVAVFATTLACMDGALAQGGSDVCLRSGMTVRAIRIEPGAAGRFKLYFDTASPPLEVGADEIRSIGQPCAPAAESQRAAQPAAAPAPDTGARSFGIHGSNTIGEQLMPMLLDAYAAKRFGTKPSYRARAPEELDIDILGSGAKPVARIDLQAKGSGTAVKALLDRTATIGMISRRAQPQEVEQVSAMERINLTAAGNEHVLALDGLAVIVNRDNPMRQLALPTIARIFSGEVRNWSQVSGRDADGRDISGADMPIILHARNNKSGTFDTFVSLVMNPAGKSLAAEARRYESSDLLSDAVAAERGAIGFVGLPYVNKNHALAIQSPCGLFSAPTRYSIKTEEYPLTRRLYLYTIGAPGEPIARELLDFALSERAQATIADAGFVEQSIEIEDAREQAHYVENLVARPDTATGKPVPAETVTIFSRLLGQLRHTSVVFRFEKSGTDLDTRAMQDLARLASFLRASERAGKRFVIAGFADANGSWQANLALSTERAQRVAAELRRQGISVTDADVLAFSFFAPVACNDTDAGRARNRRVEIWVTQ